MPARSRAAVRRLDVPSVFVLGAFAGIYATAWAIRAVPTWVHVLYAGASALCFALYAIDKAAAVDGRDRIPESTLLWLGAVGGWPGALVAQQLLRHKTAKRSFRLRYWLSVLANVAAFSCVTVMPSSRVA